MEFNITGRAILPYVSSGEQNGAFWYIVLRVMRLLDSILELCRTFPNDVTYSN